MGPQALGDALESIDQQERVSLYPKYRSMLKMRTLGPPEIQTLHDLARRLGKSPEDVRQDAVALQRAQLLADEIDDAKAVREEAIKAQSDLEAAALKLSETIIRLQSEHRQRVFASDQLQNRWSRGGLAENNLRELVKGEPLLLEHLADKRRE
jgi:hypothetical protein